MRHLRTATGMNYKWIYTCHISIWQRQVWCKDKLWRQLIMPLSRHPLKPKHNDVNKLKHFPRYWPFVLEIHRSPVNSPHKGQRHWALMFSLICVWINGWVNICEAGDLRRYRANYDANIMTKYSTFYGRQFKPHFVVWCPVFFSVRRDVTITHRYANTTHTWWWFFDINSSITRGVREH